MFMVNIIVIVLFSNEIQAQQAYQNGFSRRSCELRSDQNYLDIDLLCWTCPHTYKARRSDDSCYQIDCLDSQIYERTGDCLNCPNYNHPNSDKNKCEQDNCESIQILNIEGKCSDCPAFARADDAGTACTSSTCSDTQIITVDGSCGDCEEYTRPDSFGQSCTSDNCFTSQIKLLDGTCSDCQAFSRPDTSGVSCISDSCSQSQIKNIDGTCSDCWDYTRPDASKTNCISDICWSNQIKMLDGTCQECQDYTRPNEEGLFCIQDDCTSTSILNFDGTCKECSDYTRPNSQSKSCIADTCTSSQIKTISGTCFTCDDYTRPNAATTKCIQDRCASNEIIRLDGSCEACPAFKRPDETGKTCIDAQCSSTQIRTQSGNCQECSAYSRPNDAETQCITDNCDNSEFLTITGTCLKCDDYSHRDSSGKSCVSNSCSNTQILKIDGYCEQCTTYSRADNDGKKCITDSCSKTQKLTTTGNCESCNDYSRPDEQGKNCIQDPCSQTQIQTIFGTCSECYTYTFPDTNSQSCISAEARSKSDQSHQQRMQSFFGTEPAWYNYNADSERTLNVKKYMFDQNRYGPAGSILGPLTQLGRVNINTPIMNEMDTANVVQTYDLRNIQFNENNDKIKVDLFILSEYLEQDQISVLMQALSGGKCCWKHNDYEPFFELMLTGFARIITYHEDKGILRFQEGHFHRGVQDNFGRFIVQKESSSDGITQYMFTGWIPNELNTGLGYSMVENKYLDKPIVSFNGEWSPRMDFPNNGYDFIYPYPFEEVQIDNSWNSYREIQSHSDGDVSQLNDLFEDYNANQGLQEDDPSNSGVDLSMWEDQDFFGKYPYMNYAGLVDPFIMAGVWAMYIMILGDSFWWPIILIIEIPLMISSQIYTHQKWKGTMVYQPWQYFNIDCEYENKDEWKQEVCQGNAGAMPEWRKILLGIGAFLMRFAVFAASFWAFYGFIQIIS